MKLQRKSKLITSLFILLLSTQAYSMSGLSFMVKSDETTESYVKITNKNDPLFLKLSCNNFINKIDIKLIGANSDNFMSRNNFPSKIIFGQESYSETWKLSYDDNGSIELILRKDGFEFSKNLYKSGKVMIDLPELKNIKLFEIENKNHIQDKLSLALENCGIYI